ncbi:MAG: phospholipase D family protein [Candidatus Eisenbacteria bacterium]|uniref:phospholipase D n=1 Tax=Eiseniibacteriota bacterium TaxID=2212470 RepID=A0A948RTD6_UNCEI|nr:phospholipase D family protein [Candidatus Eisenbacteria bacterium]
MNPRTVTRHFLASCQDTLRIVMYKFTDKKTAQWIKTLLKQGVVVEMVMDGQAAVDENERPWAALVSRGMQLRIWPPRSGKLHAKFALADGSDLLTGSSNWTSSGMVGNFEVLLWSRTPSVVASYEEIFRSLWQAAEPLQGEDEK